MSKLTLLVTSCILLWSCGGTGQDDGTVSPESQTFSGLAIDGQVARATVYLDINNNVKRDPWEDTAFTDNQGYYSFNPVTDTDYCRADAPAQEAIYCLTTQSPVASAIVRVDGGYDTVTGEPFLGQLSRRINVSESGEVESAIVSPLTSLLSDIEDADERRSILSSLGIDDESALDINYLDIQNDGSADVDAELLAKALAVHKVVTVLSDRVNDSYAEIGDSFGAPNDASGLIYRSLAQNLLQSEVTLDEVLADESSLLNVLEEAEVAIREIYEDRDYDLPNDIDSSSGESTFNRGANIAASITDVVDTLFPENTAIELNEAIGSSRALETLVIKSVEEAGEDSSVDNVVSFFSSEGNEALVDALLGSLQQEDADLGSLINNDFVGEDFDSEEEILAASTQPLGAEPFFNIAGTTLKVSDLDLGQSNDLDDSEVEFYFQGNEGSIEGSFSACAKYIDGAENDGSLGDGNTRGELVNGFWSLLGATEDNVQSYSVLITLEFLGATYQAILKTGGTEIIRDVEYDRVRFDFDGELNVWHSESGVTNSIQSLPVSNEECRERLPLRIQFDN